MEEQLNRAGYIIVRSFEHCYNIYDRPCPQNLQIYGIPRIGVEPSQATKKYRGVNRYPLLTVPENLSSELPVVESQAQFRLGQLESNGRAHDDYVAALDDALSVFLLLSMLELWELIHVTIVGGRPEVSLEGEFFGYDVAYFGGDHYSAVANCMFFPSWVGTDEEGQRYHECYESLNSHGLFDSADDAMRFLNLYRAVTSDTGEYLEILRIDSPEIAG